MKSSEKALLCQREALSLQERKHIAVGLSIEVVPELRWQEVRKPGGLIATLFTDEHQHHVVHHRVVDPSRHHRHEPFLQILIEQQLFVGIALDVDRERQLHDGIALLLLPGWQLFQVETERVILGHEVTLYHPIDVGRPYRFGG